MPAGARGFDPRALLAVALWGGSLPATRVALEAFSPLALVSTRSALGAVLLVGLARVRTGRLLPERADRGVCAFLGLVLGAHLLIQTHGLRHTTAIQTGWIIGFQPVTIALGALLLLRERLGRGGWLGVGVATLGVALVTLREPPNFENARLGDLLALSTCLTWTVYTLAAGRSVARSGPLRVTAASSAVAALVLLTAWPLVGETGPALPLAAEPLAAWLYLGVLCSGLAYLLWYAALARIGATATGAMLYLEPLFTLAAATLLLSEPVTANALVGGPLVLLGVSLVSRHRRRAAAAASG